MYCSLLKSDAKKCDQYNSGRRMNKEYGHCLHGEFIFDIESIFN